jgi:hypothetical protein
MKLKIMTVGGVNLPGGVAFVLCDEDGKMLPCQSAVAIAQEQGECSTITVTFEINGRDVVLDGGRAPDTD